MKRTTLLTGLVVLLVSVLGLLLFGPRGEGVVSPPLASESPTGAPETPEVEPETAFLAGMFVYGGMCPEGPCEQGYMITNDGTLLFGVDELTPVAVVPEAELTELRNTISEEINAEMDIRPFEGTCATAVDGVAFIFYFYAETGMAELDSCQWDLSELKSPVLVQDIISDYLRSQENISPSDVTEELDT